LDRGARLSGQCKRINRRWVRPIIGILLGPIHWHGTVPAYRDSPPAPAYRDGLLGPIHKHITRLSGQLDTPRGLIGGYRTRLSGRSTWTDSLTRVSVSGNPRGPTEGYHTRLPGRCKWTDSLTLSCIRLSEYSPRTDKRMLNSIRLSGHSWCGGSTRWGTASGGALPPCMQPP